MQILDRDDRWLTDVNPISYRTDDITFYEMKITWSYAWCIADMVKWNNYFVWEETITVPFWEERKIFDVAWKWNSFVIEYTSEELRNKDIELLNQEFELDWKHFTKLLENNRHIPEFDWYFEYDWKYYIIVDWLNKLTTEIDEKVWVYKWVIVAPEKYYKVQKQLNDSIDQVENIL